METTVSKIISRLERDGLDAIVLSSPDNARYCTGFMVPSHPRNRRRRVFVMLTAQGDTAMIVVTVEENISRNSSLVQPVIAYNEFSDDPVRMMADFLKEKKAFRRVAVELDNLCANDCEKLRTYLPDTALIDGGALMNDIRCIKTEQEIEIIARCCQIADEVYQMLAADARGHMTEMELYGMALKEMAMRGVEYPRMALGSGHRAGDANAKATDKRLESGDIVRFDVLGEYKNYNLDIARTAVVGPASQRQRDDWKRLYEVHLRSIDRIKPGASSKDIYLRFNEDMEKIFGIQGTLNFLGHGLGLSVHEPPYFNITSDTILQENMVLCLEPMYLVPNKVGYHVEDCIVVRSHGAQVLSNLDSGAELFQISI